jgi:hypothetical protein
MDTNSVDCRSGLRRPASLDALEAAGVLLLEGDGALAERIVALFPLSPKVERT